MAEMHCGCMVETLYLSQYEENLAALRQVAEVATARAERAEAENTELRAKVGRVWVLLAEFQSHPPHKIGNLRTVAELLLAALDGPPGAALDSTQPDTPAPGRDGEEKRLCPACGSPRWVSVSLDEGWTRRAQCVPCGAYHPGVIGPGWRAQARSDSGLPVDGEERK